MHSVRLKMNVHLLSEIRSTTITIYLEMMMKKLVLLLLFLFVAAVSRVNAQQDYFADSTPEERAGLVTDYMVESLSLSDSTQIAKVQAINLEYAKKNEKVMKSNDRRLPKLRKLKSLGEDKDKDLKKVLTNDQFSLYMENKEIMREKMKEKMKERRAGGN